MAADDATERGILAEVEHLMRFAASAADGGAGPAIMASLPTFLGCLDVFWKQRELETSAQYLVHEPESGEFKELSPAVQARVALFYGFLKEWDRRLVNGETLPLRLDWQATNAADVCKMARAPL